MTNVEAVIECLGSTIHNAEWANKITTSCDVGFLKEIYAMLKSQKPRVMTLEEAKGLHPDDDVYIERISSITGVHYIYATTIWRVFSKSIQFCPDNATLWFSEYGETWRCWTSRPIDGQREATAWDC